jgi:hypothetical protein
MSVPASLLSYVENRVRHSITCIVPYAPRHLPSRFVLRRLKGQPRGPEPAAGFDHEEVAQVELAQLKYSLPRLGQKDDSLSRLTGGIGGRGPGETKLETDRRRIRERIDHLEREIECFARLPMVNSTSSGGTGNG